MQDGPTYDVVCPRGCGWRTQTFSLVQHDDLLARHRCRADPPPGDDVICPICKKRGRLYLDVVVQREGSYSFGETRPAFICVRSSGMVQGYRQEVWAHGDAEVRWVPGRWADIPPTDG